MAQTRKIRGGAPPAFKNAKPANLVKLSKADARNFIRGVCTRDLPNYLALIKKERGCVNNVCPTKMTQNQKQWAEVEGQFKTQCATAERLKLIKNIPATTNLDPSYIKSTADRLIEDMKAPVAKFNTTAKVAANAKAKANANAKAKANANAKAKAAADPLTAVQQYLMGPPSATPKPVNVATTASSPAAAKYLSTPKSTIEQNIQKITQNLQAAKQVLASMAKTGGAKNRRTRRN